MTESMNVACMHPDNNMVAFLKLKYVYEWRGV